uniref:Uncharacterized protein n=1 Tax=viral metagenome TaxID=1070528 RepID=A0A6C0E050_9ZZZZ
MKKHLESPYLGKMKKYLIKLDSLYLDGCDYYYNTKTNSVIKYDRIGKKWSNKIDIDVIKSLKFYAESKRRTSKKIKKRLKSSKR